MRNQISYLNITPHKMDLSSSSLFSQEFQITQDGCNTICNAVYIYQNSQNGVYDSNILIPSFGSDYVSSQFIDFENHPELRIKFFAYQSGFLFFFYRSNGQSYQVVTNDDMSYIYRVTKEYLVNDMETESLKR